MIDPIDDHPLLAKINTFPPYLLLLVILFFVCLSYSNTLHSPLMLDDRATFIDEPKIYIENLSPDSLRQLATTRFGLPRFLPIITFAIDHLLGKGSLVQFHLTNIAIHILATIAVYLFLQTLCNTPTVKATPTSLYQPSFCLFITAFWALHPVQTNAVTYLVQRMASLMALFYFAALTCYILARTNRSRLRRMVYWCGLILFTICAFLSKENSFTLPLSLLLIEMLFISPEAGGKILARIRWYHITIAAFLLVLFLPIFITKFNPIYQGYAIRHFTLPERVLTELRVVVFYLSLLTFPLPGRLNLDHDFTLSHSLWVPPTTFASLLFLALLVWLAFKVRRNHPLISFGILFFFLNLIIESSIIGLELIFEHRLYLPSLGFFIVIVALFNVGVQLIGPKHRNDLQTIFFLGGVIITCILSTFTTLRNAVWLDEYTLMVDTAQKSPNKPRVQTNLGLALENLDRYDEAMTALERAMALGKGHYEEYLKAANNIVSILIIQKRYQEAADRAEKYLKEMPRSINWDGFPKIMINLGIAYWKLGNYQSSFDAFALGISIANHHAVPVVLGAMEAMLLDAMTSEEGRLQLGLENKPAAIYCKIAATLLAKRDYHNADSYLKIALNKDGNDLKALEIQKKYADEVNKNKRAIAEASHANKPITLSNFRYRSLLFLAGFIDNSYPPLRGAIDYLLEEAVRLEPADPVAGVYLAGWRLKRGQTDAAIALTEKYLHIAPDFFPLLKIAGTSYQLQGNSVIASAMYSKLLAIYPGHPDWAEYEALIRTSAKTNSNY